MWLKNEVYDEVLKKLHSSSDYELTDISETIAQHIRLRRESIDILKNKINRLCINTEEKMDSLVESFL